MAKITVGEGGPVHMADGVSDHEIQNCDAGSVFIANNECLLEMTWVRFLRKVCIN